MGQFFRYPNRIVQSATSTGSEQVRFTKLHQSEIGSARGQANLDQNPQEIRQNQVGTMNV